MPKLTPQKQQILDNFSQLSEVDMKTKLKLIIKGLDTTNLPALKNVAIAIDENPLVEVTFLVGVYKEILLLMDAVDEISKNAANSRLQGIYSKLEEMKRQEELERQQENPDDLLKNL